MPVSVVVGGQFGSEGKGKVALEIVRRDPSTAAVVRVGGTNSGHTAIGRDGVRRALRQLPAAAIDGRVMVILPSGSYIDPEIFLREVRELNLTPATLAVSPFARIITGEHKRWEEAGDLGSEIGSTQSGTGGSVLAATAREARGFPLHAMFAEDHEACRPYLRNTIEVMRALLDRGQRILVEGTQGFGLSILHGGFWPKATSRDTTAAGFLSETGLSPLDVDDVTLVIRCHPIRVAGDSGPLTGETTWDSISAESGAFRDLREYTTVTNRIRRVGRFDAQLVKAAVEANRPTRVVLNHLDYIDSKVKDGLLTTRAIEFVRFVERSVSRKIDWLGLSPDTLVNNQSEQLAMN